MTMNTSDPNARHDGEKPQLPPALVAALKELPSRRVFVPPTVDEAVLRAARRHLAREQRTGWAAVRSWLTWPALATACVVIAGFVFLQPKQRGEPNGFVREDRNHDGQVDILDAFQLAREVRAGRPLLPALDFNRDGVVDRRDAELVATRAVKLAKGGRS